MAQPEYIAMSSSAQAHPASTGVPFSSDYTTSRVLHQEYHSHQSKPQSSTVLFLSSVVPTPETAVADEGMLKILTKMM